ncbi:chromosome segregation protein SMC [Rothia sp. ZJ1223]|uniref:chromosome segregation protein SMC n=1 Tax=Rothia sp. ZJ1223 TaxID=2811098 RepID=UPI0019595E57|nr:chromosome segregation protein SMC [Rothia sp. ZJ1223]MBM7050921.1 chromosome segregation protein SMC [Rothia sp. ZJ1223]
MHVRSVTIRGFKSFASATTFEFDRGLTAVVGPNGSGKSNVVDALSWVMGEQGSKSLRGGTMQDVIFAGSGERAALGRAQVVLTLDNSDASLELPTDEVTISRTMFRSGGSEYEINGSPVRLADVQELLARAGIGKHMHTVVGQGQLERFLTASPDERRTLIEEAAGITVYRRRQDQTARRLDSMRENLTRVEDLTRELETQLEPLGEQAEAARAAGEVQAQIRATQRQLLTVQAQNLQQQVLNARTALSASGQEHEAAAKTIESLQSQDSEISQHIVDTQRQITATESRVHTYRGLHHQVQATQALAHERSQQRAFESEPYEHAVNRATALYTLTTSENLEASWASHDARERLETARIITALAETEQVTAQQRVDTAHTAAKEEAAARSRALEQVAAAHARTVRAADELQERQRELSDVQELITHGDHTLSQQREAHRALKVELAEAQQAAEDARIARTRAAEEVTDCAAQQARIHQHHVALTAEINTLQRTVGSRSQAANAPESYSQLYTEYTVEPGWEPALAAALHGADEAWLAPDTRLQPDEEHLSQVYLPIDLSTADNSTPPPAEFQPLLQLVTANQRVRPMLEAALAHTYAVATVEEGLELVTQRPHTLAYTPEGTRISRWSVLYTHQTTSLTELSAALSSARAQHEELQHKITAAEEKQKQLVARKQEAVKAEKKSAHTVGVLTTRVHESERAISGAKARLETLDQELTRHTHRVKTATERHRAAEEKLTAARAQLDAPNNSSPAEIEHLEHALMTARTRATRASAALSAASARYDATSTSAQLSATRRDDARQNLHTAQQQLADALAQYQGNQRLRTQAAETLAKTEVMTRVLEKARAHETHHLEQLRARSEKLAVQREDITSQLTIARAHQQAHDTEKNQRSIRLAKLETALDELARRVYETLALEISQLLQDSPVENDEMQLATDLEKLNSQLEKMGVTNPLALEEYTALSERHRYLTDQLSDLKASRSDLRSIMKDVNTHITDAFMSAFKDVSAAFTDAFSALFPGGEGTLVLTDPADALNTGVEVHARPAGKKVKRLSLLSGGERSLASLAFAVALFKARPAPFYVLDEVEATLDDRNLGRVLEVIDDLAEQSQVLMITHKTRSMEAANSLYGVSMREGVSRVVSQNVDRIRQLLNSAGA